MQIQDKAMLVRLGIGMPGNGRKDKPITAEVTANHQLAGNAGKWLKTLYPPEAFAPVTEAAGEARTFHYANTLPWMDDGQRILHVTHYTEFTSAMRGFRVKFNDLAENHFLSQIAKWEAMAKNNGTFRPEDYLSVGKLRDKFSFRVGFDPIPSGDDFRVSITSGDLDAIKDDMAARLQQAVSDAQAELWRRLADPLAKMVERLKDPTATFRDSLIGNLQEIVTLIPSLNLTADKHLAGFANEVKISLAGLSPDVLRQFPSQRNAAAVRAQEILDKMSGYFPTTP